MWVFYYIFYIRLAQKMPKKDKEITVVVSSRKNDEESNDDIGSRSVCGRLPLCQMHQGPEPLQQLRETGLHVHGKKSQKSLQMQTLQTRQLPKTGC